MKTVSLELSKALKENGYPQKSDFSWVYQCDDNDKRTGEKVVEHEGWIDYCEGEKNVICASPTAEEILEQLLSFVDYDGKIFNLTITHEISGWNVAYATRKDILMREFMDESLGDAGTLMWLYLKKEGLL